MLKIYHNPNCSKSHQALEILENSNAQFEIVLYIKLGWTKQQLQSLIKKAGGDIHTILRPADKFYKLHDLSQANMGECISIAIQNPSVIERPLIETANSVFVARPPEKLLKAI